MREIEQRVYEGRGEAWLAEFPGDLDITWLPRGETSGYHVRIPEPALDDPWAYFEERVGLAGVAARRVRRFSVEEKLLDEVALAVFGLVVSVALSVGLSVGAVVGAASGWSYGLLAGLVTGAISAASLVGALRARRSRSAIVDLARWTTRASDSRPEGTA